MFYHTGLRVVFSPYRKKYKMEPLTPPSSARVRIAYFCVNDPLDRRSWSGITYYLGQSLQRNIGDVDFLGPVKFPSRLDKVLRGMAKFTRTVFGTEYYTKYSFLQNW